jgi:hypothetical protein
MRYVTASNLDPRLRGDDVIISGYDGIKKRLEIPAMNTIVVFTS